VRDAVPLAGDNPRVRVVLRKPVGLAEAKEGEKIDIEGASVAWAKGGEKTGQIEWKTGAIEPGGELMLDTEFEVRAPAEMRWVLRHDV
jgi:hypothetical protein